jgi:uncharacterized protein YdhG (YjbR/CyaY superfamily)
MNSMDAEAYYRNAPLERRSAMKKVRDLILETVPDLSESMKYNMPTYERDDVVCALTSQKKYMSLYLDTELVEKYKHAFSHLNVGKSCVRFRRIEELPLETVRVILEETVTRQEAG